MGVVTTKYVRNPLYVDAVQVSNTNFLDVANWAQALVGVQGAEPGTEIRPATGVEIDPATHYIRIRVHSPKSQRQTQAFVGDWILYTDRGYKIYNDKAFRANFSKVDIDGDIPIPGEQTVQQEQTIQNIE